MYFYIQLFNLNRVCVKRALPTFFGFKLEQGKFMDTDYIMIIKIP